MVHSELKDERRTASAVSPLLTTEEELEILDLYRTSEGSSMTSLSSLDRALTLELRDTDRLLSHALEDAGSASASLSEYLSEVERALQDIDAWSTVFDTKLINMRRNIDIIKARNDALGVTALNKQRVLASIRQLLLSLEFPTEVEKRLQTHSLEGERAVDVIMSDFRSLFKYQSDLRRRSSSNLAMRATQTVLHRCDELVEKTISRVFTEFSSCVEDSTASSGFNAQENQTWTMHANYRPLEKFRELFQLLDEFRPCAKNIFIKRHGETCGRNVNHMATSSIGTVRIDSTDSGSMKSVHDHVHGMIICIGSYITKEISHASETFKFNSETRKIYFEAIISGMQQCFGEVFGHHCAAERVHCVALASALRRARMDDVVASLEILDHPLACVQTELDRTMEELVGDVMASLRGNDALHSSHRKSRGEYDHSFAELSAAKKIITFSTSDAATVDSQLEQLFVDLFEAAQEYVERTAQKETKRRGKVRLQGYRELAGWLCERATSDSKWFDVKARLMASTESARLNYISEVCEKHFGSIISDIHSLHAVGRVGSTETHTEQTVKSYKLVFQSRRAVEKNVANAAKTIMKDLHTLDVRVSAWRAMESHVIQAVRLLERAAGNSVLQTLDTKTIQELFQAQQNRLDE